jgi:hypothetical protein
MLSNRVASLSRLLRRSTGSLGSVTAALLLALFAFHIGDCHISADYHAVASPTRTIEIVFGITNDHTRSAVTVAADGGAKQYAYIALSVLPVLPRIAVAQDAQSAISFVVAGKNTALAHRKLTALLI